MFNRVYIKSLISFDEVELELEKGLVVISGSSGAGKSILMDSILSSFGYGSAKASLCEISIDKPLNLKSEAYEFEEEITLKSIKKGKVRYYIDGQNISKKTLHGLFSPFVQYLSVRDKSGFDSSELIKLIDSRLISYNKSFKKLKKSTLNVTSTINLRLMSFKKL